MNGSPSFIQGVLFWATPGSQATGTRDDISFYSASDKLTNEYNEYSFKILHAANALKSQIHFE